MADEKLAGVVKVEDIKIDIKGDALDCVAAVKARLSSPTDTKGLVESLNIVVEELRREMYREQAEYEVRHALYEEAFQAGKLVILP